MNVLNWISENPWMSVFIIIVAAGVIVDAAREIFGGRK